MFLPEVGFAGVGLAIVDLLKNLLQLVRDISSQGAAIVADWTLEVAEPVVEEREVFGAYVLTRVDVVRVRWSCLRFHQLVSSQRR